MRCGESTHFKCMIMWVENKKPFWLKLVPLKVHQLVGEIASFNLINLIKVYQKVEEGLTIILTWTKKHLTTF